MKNFGLQAPARLCSAVQLKTQMRGEQTASHLLKRGSKVVDAWAVVMNRAENEHAKLDDVYTAAMIQKQKSIVPKNAREYEMTEPENVSEAIIKMGALSVTIGCPIYTIYKERIFVVFSEDDVSTHAGVIGIYEK